MSTSIFQNKKIMLTGGAGYIGSHAAITFLENDCEVAILDNFSTSEEKTVNKIERLTRKKIKIFSTDLLEYKTTCSAITEFKPDAVVHFAGLKSPLESFKSPLLYFNNNVTGSINLLMAMDIAECRKLIFSSSATIYGRPHYLPCDESHPIQPISPYGRSKYYVEKILEDWSCDSGKSVASLRYFNPIGTHPSGQLGENINLPPNNLVPGVMFSLLNPSEIFKIFGDDFETKDGTGERDYIHVMDLSSAHLNAYAYISENNGFSAFNIGLGGTASVYEIIRFCELASNRKLKYTIAGKRAGDQGIVYANPSKANSVLKWIPKYSVKTACEHAWHYVSKNFS